MPIGDPTVFLKHKTHCFKSLNDSLARLCMSTLELSFPSFLDVYDNICLLLSILFPSFLDAYDNQFLQKLMLQLMY